MKIIVGITGASGSIYGYRLVKFLNESNKVEKIYLVVSETGRKVFEYETEKPISLFGNFTKVKIFDEKDFFAPISSGSFKVDGMIILPCSTSTLSSIACGINLNLIHRAAEVCLKEKKKLVLVLRENPLNLIHVRNIEKIILSGGIVLTASPSFYLKPKAIEDLIDSVIFKALDVLGLADDNLFKRWRGKI